MINMKMMMMMMVSVDDEYYYEIIAIRNGIIITVCIKVILMDKETFRAQGATSDLLR